MGPAPPHHGLCLRHDLGSDRAQRHVSETSMGHRKDIKGSSIERQRDINRTSMRRQPDIERASTEHQWVVNGTTPVRRRLSVQRPKQARRFLRTGSTRRMGCSSSRSVPSAAPSRDSSHAGRVTRLCRHHQADCVAFGLFRSHSYRAAPAHGSLRCVDLRWYDILWTRSVVPAVRGSRRGVRYGRPFATARAGWTGMQRREQTERPGVARPRGHSPRNGHHPSDVPMAQRHLQVLCKSRHGSRRYSPAYPWSSSSFRRRLSGPSDIGWCSQKGRMTSCRDCPLQSE